MLKLIEKLIGDPNQKILKKLWPIVKKINQIETEYQQSITTDEQVQAKTAEFKDRLKQGETLDQLLPEAFALVKHACRRLNGREFELEKVYENTAEGERKKYVWNMIPYDVQLLGGIILHKGKIAEMKTGEGITLVCTCPLYLNALQGDGAYLVTVNEYLAQRDAEWMGVLYNYLGLTVGVNLHQLNREQKKAAYNCDITYGTNSEFGFDYLRDNMATNVDSIVQRKLNYAIVDEVDSILIDEARTPLIISSPAQESTDKYAKYAQLVRNLEAETHFKIDEKQRSATLTESGIKKMEELMGVDNIYTEAGFDEVHHIEQALKANAIFKKNVDYVVKDGEILIVDEFTGRLMEGRRYSDGLHQAIEAKENVEIKRESRTFATITFQNLFRLFNKLAGMTGTAKTEEEEFLRIYALETVVVPTNRGVNRKDNEDLIFKSKAGKYDAVAKRVQEAHAIGQPVLIGTVSIEQSELLSQVLVRHKIPHAVLNAKFHEQEAEIVAMAGKKGAVTIATNMAGRGTDIKLDSEVKDLGGLLVIGTERHESRRIDNQLRGRSGRQGDPGESQFYVSMQDDLMRLFGGDRMLRMMEALKLPEDMPIQNGWLSNTIESAQKKVEGRNFDIRKHLVEYDDVMNKHREIIYSRRRKALLHDNIKNEIILLIEKQAEKIALNCFKPEHKTYDYDEAVNILEMMITEVRGEFNLEIFKRQQDEEEIIEFIKTYLLEKYNNKENQLSDPNTLRQIEKSVMLSVIDTHWMEHIDAMQQLRESVSLRGYAQKDPLIEYKELAFQMFKEMLGKIQIDTLSTLYKIDLKNSLPGHLLKGNQPAEMLITNADDIEGGLNNNLVAANSWATPQQTNLDLEQAAKAFANLEDTEADQPIQTGEIIKIKADSPGTKPLVLGQAAAAGRGTGTLPCANLGRNDICPVCGVKAKKCPKQ